MDISNITYKVYEIITKRDVSGKLKILRDTQWKDNAELQKLQKQKLKEILNICKEDIPYYKEILSDCKIEEENSFEILKSIPIMTKQKIQSNQELLQNKNFHGRYYKNSSGGSTGIPVHVLQDQYRNDYNSAATKRSDEWGGLRFGTSYFQFWAAKKDLKIGFFRKLRQVLFNQYIFDAFNWNDEIILDIHNLMQKKKPKVIIAYASALYLYVEKMKKIGIESTHSPDSIITSADMLYDYQRIEIEEFFNCKIFNRYGCREIGLIASECSIHDGLHISAERLIVEIIDNKGNSTEDGSVGRVIVTDLTNTVMPMIRYEIGDLGSLSTTNICSCNRGLPKLLRLEGRVTDYVITPSGKLINGVALSTIIPKFENVEQLQILQQDVDKVTLNIVANNLYSSKDERKLLEILDAFFDRELKMVCSYQKTTLNENSGKMRFIINKL